MRLAIASGKGGTGKTLIATNLAWHLARAGLPVAYVDTDVEAPNGHLFLHPAVVEETRFCVYLPALRDATCSGCGLCQQACAFNAIIALKDRVMVFPELCHACGACLLSCEENALTEVKREIGTVRRGMSGRIGFWSGVLDVGEARSTPLIDGLLAEALSKSHCDSCLCVLDAPPGTACSAVATVRSADLVLLVTEPTPFGLHDLELAVQMCQALDKPAAAVINRSDLGSGEVRDWLQRRSIPLWAEIPFCRQVAAAYAKGELAAKTVASFRGHLDQLTRALFEQGTVGRRMEGRP